ncbi:MAG: HypC/HybG/HupF family hydrogenase formation chaperone [Candidatus Saccharicenans sp.]|nr:HypC/HybG/HupF family hydrogenase formation chaperone [Candidatus Saccharicenans sp.]
MKNIIETLRKIVKKPVCDLVDRTVWFWYFKLLEERMCLAVPGKVISLEKDGVGQVDYMGTTVVANFSLLPGIKTGDWVIIHAGFAISKLDRKEARKTLKLFQELEKLNPSE